MTSTTQRLAVKNLPPPPPPSSGADGIRVMYDEDLGSRLHFKEEIGFGNWGSVWLCTPYLTPVIGSVPGALSDVKVATKLVHRTKTATTKARVQSLWNEWKIVTSLTERPHPSIIDFYSFVVTDSYALIMMAYHPRLVSVEVPEPYARDWFHSLLSGVNFLHTHGIAHNDIKPANILLSTSNVPVLVDFGFAKHYDPQATDAFHSNLSYGTPEYLSPERAAGNLHDTRKSDIWSLGVTFFEILVGRTPFEELEGEEFNTKEQLHRYWTLTLRGQWVGEWSMSASMEKLLRRMISPNADLRCTAEAAMADTYWTKTPSPDSELKTTKAAHRTSATFSNTVDPRRIFDGVPYRQARNKDGFESAPSTLSSRGDKENVSDSSKPKEKPKEKPKARLPIGVDKENAHASPTGGRLRRSDSRSSAVLGLNRIGTNRHARSQSQTTTQIASGNKETSFSPKKAATGATQIPSLLGFSALPPTSYAKHGVRPAASVIFKSKDKENKVLQRSSSMNLRESSSSARLAKKPLGPRKPTPPSSPVAKPQKSTSSMEQKEKGRKRGVLSDCTKVNVNEEDGENVAANTSGGSVRDRMREWERERQRLKELERVEEQKREEEAEEEQRRQKDKERELDEEMRKDIERQRLLEEELEREMEAERTRLTEIMRENQRREAEVLLEREREESEKQRTREVQSHHQAYPRISTRRFSVGSTSPDGHAPTPLSPLIEESESSRLYESSPRSVANESSLSLLKQGLKMSIDRTKRFYKSSTQVLRLSTPTLSMNGEPANYSRSRSVSMCTSWEEEMLSEGVVTTTSSLPGVLNAANNEEMATAHQLDRMTIWLKSVEKVVEDARQNFAASVNIPPPPLPVAPVARPSLEPRVPEPRSPSNRSQRSSTRTRNRRRILPANQIFVDDQDSSQVDQLVPSSFNNSHNSRNHEMCLIQDGRSMFDATIPYIPSEDLSRMSPLENSMPEIPNTPVQRGRRATIVTRSPEAERRKPSLGIEIVRPGHKEKSKSQHDLGRPITPVTRLEFELEQLSKPQPPPRLSQLVDSTIFISNSSAYKNAPCEPEVLPKDDLTASPYHVEPYPPRPMSKHSTLDTPGRKHVEGVYDRFLMSTTGVKRVGQGYQSGELANARPKVVATKRNPHFFLSTRRPMPPPVSSEDLRKSANADEFGAMSCVPVTSSSAKDDGSGAVRIVKRAIKAMTVKR